MNNNNLFRIPTSPKCFSVGSCKNDVQYSNNTIRYDTIKYNAISFFQCRFLVNFFRKVLNLGKESMFLIRVIEVVEVL